MTIFGRNKLEFDDDFLQKLVSVKNFEKPEFKIF